MVAAVLPSKKKDRLRIIDYWRGVCLLMVFVNHLPGNILSSFTLWGLGFSDSATVFVFLSGYVCYLTFNSTLERRGWKECLVRVGRRTLLLYGAHVAMVALWTGLLLVLFPLIERSTILPYHGLAERMIVDAPWQELRKAFSFRQESFLAQILPLYTLLVALVPVYLLLMRRSPWLLWGVSAAVWAALQVSVLADAGPLLKTRWWFNPFGWQFIFVSGFVLARLWRQGFKWGRLRPAFAVAGVGTFVCAALFDQHAFAFLEGVRPLFRNKALCTPTYVAHFALIVILVRQFAPDDRSLRYLPAVSFVETLGRHSLAIWVFGIVPNLVLTYAAHLLPAPDWIEDIGTASVGVFIFWLFYLRWIARDRRGDVRTPAVPSATAAGVVTSEPQLVGETARSAAKT